MSFMSLFSAVSLAQILINCCWMCGNIQWRTQIPLQFTSLHGWRFSRLRAPKVHLICVGKTTVVAKWSKLLALVFYFLLCCCCQFHDRFFSHFTFLCIVKYIHMEFIVLSMFLLSATAWDRGRVWPRDEEDEDGRKWTEEKDRGLLFYVSLACLQLFIANHFIIHGLLISPCEYTMTYSSFEWFKRDDRV